MGHSTQAVKSPTGALVLTSLEPESRHGASRNYCSRVSSWPLGYTSLPHPLFIVVLPRRSLHSCQLLHRLLQMLLMLLLYQEKKRERDIVGHHPFLEMLTGPRHKAISKAQKVADTVNGARHQPP